MVKIHVEPDCANAPKMELLKDFTLAFPLNNSDFIINNLSDDVRWEMVGEKVIEGKADATRLVHEMMDDSIEELTIATIITHGDAGAVNGVMKFKDGTTFAFCDVYKFSSHAKDAKLKSITSFIIEQKS